MYRVSLTPEARADLKELHEYISQESGRRTAGRYIRRIKKFCQEFALAPHVGESREHHRRGLRSIGFEGRVSVLFAVFDEKRLVEVEAILYGGRQHVRGNNDLSED